MNYAKINLYELVKNEVYKRGNERVRELLKRTWISKMTIVITIVQLITPLIFGRTFFNFSFLYFVLINIITTLVINCNLNWLYKKGMEEETKKYYRDAPCTMQALKFAIGILVSMAIAFVNIIYPINGIEKYAYKIIVSWYLVPLIMVFVSATKIEVGLNDNISILGKVRKIPLFLKRLFLAFFNYDKQGKIIFNLKSILSTIAFLAMIIVVVGYALSFIIN